MPQGGGKGRGVHPPRGSIPALRVSQHCIAEGIAMKKTLAGLPAEPGRKPGDIQADGVRVRLEQVSGAEARRSGEKSRARRPLRARVPKFSAPRRSHALRRPAAFLACAMACAALLTGCSADGEAFVQKSYTADAQVREIRLDVRDRQIDVSPSEDGQIHIAYFESDKEWYDIAVSDDHVLTMTSASGKDWTDYIGAKPPASVRNISLQIPDALLENISLSTTNGDVSLSALAVTGSISLASNGGNIAFERLQVGDSLSLTAKNGGISGVIAGSDDDFAIQAEVKKGDSNLSTQDGGEKQLNVSCNNGDVDIAFAP